MNKITIFLVLIINFFISCTINVNDNEKEGIENVDSKNGFYYEDKIISINTNFPVVDNEIIAGEYLVISFKGVKNATIKEGFQHVGIGVKILDEQGTILDQADDLLGNIEQQTPDYNKYFTYYGVPTKFEEGKKLTFITTLFDKYGTVSYETTDEFIVVHKPAPVTEKVTLESNIENKEITAQVFDGYLQFESVPVAIEPNAKLDIYLTGVNGFKSIEGIVFFEYIIEVISEDGKEISKLTDTFDGEVGELDSYPLSASQEFTNIAAGKYKWIVTFKDVNSNKYVKSSIDVIIE
jgi:hypothetical protein